MPFTNLPPELRLQIADHIDQWQDHKAFRCMDQTNYRLLTNRPSVRAKFKSTVAASLLDISAPVYVSRTILIDYVVTCKTLVCKHNCIPYNVSARRLQKYEIKHYALEEGLSPAQKDMADWLLFVRTMDHLRLEKAMLNYHNIYCLPELESSPNGYVRDTALMQRYCYDSYEDNSKPITYI
ncbi:hypothetical protein BJ508DRAFT_321313 [Ascobolus immersus RN42]|uniref:F-box domain-containing protein n=1 Tax=Ascobolus immersus RN42 TaxID=1160509 RepID=A0A3N4IKR0_ASCIM|nr:hypothetical protein BJ508DRAFT_321313 [Ascobolus immersus RN42]